MSQYVIDIKHDRPSPLSMEECLESGVDMGRYDLCLGMALSARRIQKRRNKDIAQGRVRFGPAHEYKNPFKEDPVIAAMRLVKEAA